MDLLYEYEKLISIPDSFSSITTGHHSSSVKKQDRKREFFKTYRNRYILIQILNYLSPGEIFNSSTINKLFFKTFLLHKEKDVKNCFK
jgi:hypothetical protein